MGIFKEQLVQAGAGCFFYFESEATAKIMVIKN
ncbi:UNVERIFIED_CONTAM: hypothetical protein BJ099_101147 [Lysinibacillus xylanilyticus]